MTYSVEASNGLLAWTTIATNPGSAGATVTVSDLINLDLAHPRRFLRLRITAP